jgi:hypothetical protein
METPSGWLVDWTALPFARLSGHPDGAWRGLIKWVFAVGTCGTVETVELFKCCDYLRRR